MNSKLPRWLVILISLFIILVILIALIPTLIIPILARQSFPVTEGEIQLGGLDSPVDIYRDQMGVPHIYASTLHDLFFAQGYVHAQERFWQMDFWRHIGSARLSEMFGASQVETDIFLRSLGWRQIAEQEFVQLTSESQAILNAYAEGVNAYLGDRQGAKISLEYVILSLLNPDYQPESWTPIHSLTWAKAMAWDLHGNLEEEIERSILLKTFTPQQVDQLLPSYPQDHPIIVPEIGKNPIALSSATSTSLGQAHISVLQALDLGDLQHNLTLMQNALGPTGSAIGSNSWVISGQRTTSGMPLLANDPHLGIQMPSIWYQVSLHCLPKSDTCPYEVAGFSFAGVPGVVIGHNDRIAWGFTNVGPDIMDLYIEKINPENLNQYEVNGQWVDMQIHTETIQVSGDEPVSIEVRQTRHGPLISDTFAPLIQVVTPDPKSKETQLPYQDKTGIDLPQPYAIALRWTALEPSYLFEAVWGFNRASNWEQFRQAASKFVVPAQNLVYADVDGNIGYQMPGNVPIRKNGDGRLPVPGWTDDYEWTGYIPFEELPYTLNPAQGYIVTANNLVNPPDYPHLITHDWDYGYRAQRIVDMLESYSTLISIPEFQTMQADNTNLNAAALVPLLNQIEGLKQDPHLAILADWNYSNDIQSKPAAFFEYFWWFLLKSTIADEPMLDDYWPDGGSRWFEVFRQLADQPDSPWWDDQATSVIETRDEILVKVFAETVSTLEKEYGRDSSKWPAWGELHTATFSNPTLGESGIQPIEKLFNRGPFQTAGGNSIINATGWKAFDSFQVVSLPSMRMIVDLSDLNKSLTVHTTGQSGHAYHPHYIDMADLWRNIQYYPMYWSAADIIEAAQEHLILTP